MESLWRIHLIADLWLRRFAASEITDPAGADPFGISTHGTLHCDDGYPDGCGGTCHPARRRWTGLREVAHLSSPEIASTKQEFSQLLFLIQLPAWERLGMLKQVTA